MIGTRNLHTTKAILQKVWGVSHQNDRDLKSSNYKGNVTEKLEGSTKMIRI